jgi:Ca2+-binding EF-hand superfamily protein
LTGSQFDELIEGMESSNGQIVIEDFIKKVMCDDEAGRISAQ